MPYSSLSRRFFFPILRIPIAVFLTVALTISTGFCGNREEGRLQAFIDPSTGKLRAPTDEEVHRHPEHRSGTAIPMNNALTGSIPVPVQTRLPSGAISVDIGASGMSYAVAKRKPDGTVAMQCDTESKSAQQALTNIQQSDVTLHEEPKYDR